MSSLCLWAFVAEIMLSMFIVWGFAHEDRFTAFEHRAWKMVRRYAKVIYGAILRRKGA